ncbi:hypothetical protein AB1Y20_019835 [Prymnesium parvum]|uniref:Auxin efflux carrier component n=1 Tax=Prymnesium parvum TaxID=97485 RepID=A0AB34JTE8_PRYPA
MQPRMSAAVLAALPLDTHALRLTGESMAELLTSCAIGYSATRLGLLDGAAVRSLARVVFNLFLPSMLLTSVATTVSRGAGSLSALLVVPLLAWAQTALGVLAGAASLRLIRTERASAAGRGVTVLSSFGNSGVLPLIFVHSLFRHAADAATRQRAASLVAMYLLGWSPVFWTLGYALLTGASSPSPSPSASSPSSFPSPLPAAPHASPADLRARLARAVNPPIVACLAGLLIGVTPPLRRLLLPSAAGAPPPLPLYRCLENFGKAYSPAAVLALAGSLATPAAGRPAAPHELGHRAAHVFAISLSRLVLVPLASFGALHAALRLRLLPADPLRDFVLLLQSCMPPAQNAVLALQVGDEPESAARMARVLLAVYLIAAVPVAGILSLLLQQYAGRLGLSIPR